MLQQHSTRTGGIFLATEALARSYTQCLHRFFEAKSAPSSLLDISSKANDHFLRIHAEYAKHKLASIKHIIVYLGGHLHLWQSESPGIFTEIDKAVTPALEESYVLHKTLIHKMTELIIIWDGCVQRHVSREMTQANIQRVGEELEMISTALSTTEMPNKTQHLSTIRLLMTAILQSKSCSTIEELDCLQRRCVLEMGPAKKAYGQECARLQLEGLNTIMTDWFSLHSINSESSRVILVGTRGPRKKLIEKQYFEDLYKKMGIAPKVLEDSVIYEERAAHLIPGTDIKMLIDDLGKFILNQTVGLKGLGNRKAMKKDVLGAHAPDILGRMECPYK